jgi:small acid-soluble spore protein I (minor)
MSVRFGQIDKRQVNAMELDLRKAVLQRVQNKSDEDILAIINDSIGGQDELLPSLGVLFEVIWEHIDADRKKELVSTLSTYISPNAQKS